MIKEISAGAAATLMAAASASAAAREPTDQPRRIIIDVTAPTSIDDAWEMWTTEAGLETYFAPDVIIDPRVGGEFSAYFMPDNPPGERGAEGMSVLVFEPEKRLSLTWNAPPKYPNARAQRSVVTVTFDKLGDNETRVVLVHDHFGDGEEWDNTIAYFERAWTHFVIPHFLYAVENGPVPWGEVDLAPVEAALIN